MLKEFKEFALRGNVIDLAIGVIIGGAFGKIVSSFVNDIVMPIINPLIPGKDWKLIEVGYGIKIGSFLGTVVDFLIIAIVIFLVVRVINSTRKKEADTPPAAPPADILLLTEIRDLLKNSKAPH